MPTWNIFYIKIVITILVVLVVVTINNVSANTYSIEKISYDTGYEKINVEDAINELKNGNCESYNYKESNIYRFDTKNIKFKSSNIEFKSNNIKDALDYLYSNYCKNKTWNYE